MNQFKSPFDDGVEMTSENYPIILASINYVALKLTKDREWSWTPTYGNLFASAVVAWREKYPEYCQMFDHISECIHFAQQDNKKVPRFALAFYRAALREIERMV